MRAQLSDHGQAGPRVNASPKSRTEAPLPEAAMWPRALCVPTQDITHIISCTLEAREARPSVSLQ